MPEVSTAPPPRAQSETLTLDRTGGFTAERVFDLGQDIASVLIAAAASALTPDGETFGSDAGDVFVAIEAQFSFDGSAYTAAGAPGSPLLWVPAGLASLYSTSDQGHALGTTPRFLKLVGTLASIDTGSPYAGANNPTATVDVRVDYV